MPLLSPRTISKTQEKEGALRISRSKFKKKTDQLKRKKRSHKGIKKVRRDKWKTNNKMHT